MIGYDYQLYYTEGIKIPLYISIDSHLVVVGGSGSGKSTSVLYWIYKARKYSCEYYITDFKASHEFKGISEHYAEFECCYSEIKAFYKIFLNTPEGGDGTTKILLIDEIAGLLAHYGITKEGKTIAEEIRQIMSSILMLGRSRKCFLWLSLQRYSATIFPASSGAADNFQCCVGLGRLSVDGRRGLFAGESLENEETLQFGQGKGIVLIDGQPLKALVIPKVSKQRLLELLQR
ncbi:hypothetical protein [Clostridium chromiireducens]|nr:hypothetical protein [Clostridium chromiireducens]